MTIKLDLPPELEQYVAEKVRRGDYGSATELILDYLQRQRAVDERKFAELKQLIDEGIAEAERGEGEPLDIDEILAEVRAEAKAKKADSGAA